jgi:hypothetical protein
MNSKLFEVTIGPVPDPEMVVQRRVAAGSRSLFSFLSQQLQLDQPETTQAAPAYFNPMYLASPYRSS